MGLSRRAYARHRKERGLVGGTDAAVRKAISTGRIDVEADGTINPAKADAQWAASTDKNKVRSADAIEKGVASARETIEAGEEKPVTKAQVEAVETGAAEAERMDAPAGGMTMAKAAAADKAYSAQLKRLKFEQLKGSLVSRKKVEAHIYDVARRERDAWMQFPAKKAALMAADLGVDAHLMEQVLDRFIRDHLMELAEIKIDISAS